MYIINVFIGSVLSLFQLFKKYQIKPNIIHWTITSLPPAVQRFHWSNPTATAKDSEGNRSQKEAGQ